eukprot:gene10038-20901_t
MNRTTSKLIHSFKYRGYLSVISRQFSRPSAGIRMSTSTFNSAFSNSYNECNGMTKREYSITKRNDNPLIMGGVGIVVAAVTVQYALKLYNAAAAASEQAKTEESASQTQETSTTEKTGAKTESKTETTGSMFDASWFARTFYDGGFEDKMSRREAALILGVRESATTERIKDAHRKILVLNHPDRGGSAYIAAKVNEAKDLLLKGK